MFSFYRYHLNILVFLLLMIAPIQAHGNCDEYNIKHILILNSYHKGLAWSDSLMDGIEDVFRQQDQFLCNLHFEFLYTKQISDTEHYDNMFKCYRINFKTTISI